MATHAYFLYALFCRGGDSSDTDDEFAALDDHAKAEVRALARKWLRGPQEPDEHARRRVPPVRFRPLQ